VSTEKLRILFERRRTSDKTTVTAAGARGVAGEGGVGKDELEDCQEFLAAAFSLLLRYDALGGHGCARGRGGGGGGWDGGWLGWWLGGGWSGGCMGGLGDGA